MHVGITSSEIMQRKYNALVSLNSCVCAAMQVCNQDQTPTSFDGGMLSVCGVLMCMLEIIAQAYTVSPNGCMDHVKALQVMTASWQTSLSLYQCYAACVHMIGCCMTG